MGAGLRYGQAMDQPRPQHLQATPAIDCDHPAVRDFARQYAQGRDARAQAVALYLAQNTGRRYDTLFSDETDGPLDPERKRMFMAMKRRVLELGGYAREFFVSQTPELTGMADALIDLEAMSVEGCST